MSFLKGIGKMIKKNVNFKNVVKLGGQLANAIPVVGGQVSGVIQGLQDAHYARKQANAEAQEIAMQSVVNNAGTAVGTIAGQALNRTAETLYKNSPQIINNALAPVGAKAIDVILKEWFKKHWKTLTGIVVGIAVIFFVLPKLMNRSTSKRLPLRR